MITIRMIKAINAAAGKRKHTLVLFCSFQQVSFLTEALATQGYLFEVALWAHKGSKSASSGKSGQFFFCTRIYVHVVCFQGHVSDGSAVYSWPLYWWGKGWNLPPRRNYQHVPNKWDGSTITESPPRQFVELLMIKEEWILHISACNSNLHLVISVCLIIWVHGCKPWCAHHVATHASSLTIGLLALLVGQLVGQSYLWIL